MDYEGTIIEESLKDKTVLQSLKIISTKVEPITEAHRTPWLKQWTLHAITVPSDKAQATAEKLSHNIEDSHTAWYIDFKNDTTHYVIFPGKVFRIDRTKEAQYQAATDYGISLGIPDYQLDFSPYIVQWQHPST